MGVVFPNVIVVNPNVPVHSLGELVAYVKANPGKMAYGSAGTGTLNHLSGELLKSLTGITDLPHVPYRGAGPAIADAIGDQIPMIIPAMTNQVLEFHRTGKLRLLAITNPARIPVAPEIPTAVESGIPGLFSQQVLGLFAPAGTPKPVIAQIDEANHRAMAAVLGVILKLPPLKQALASKQFKSIYLDKLLSNKSAKRP